jgi:hypothetical protein
MWGFFCCNRVVCVWTRGGPGERRHVRARGAGGAPDFSSPTRSPEHNHYRISSQQGEALLAWGMGTYAQKTTGPLARN